MIQLNSRRHLLFSLCLILLTFGCAKREVQEVSPTGLVSPQTDTSVLVEPEFLSEPLFCKIAVGPDSDFIFWTATDLDAGKVYFDLNQNDDWTDPGEAFELVESSQINETRYWSTVIPQIKQGDDVHTDLTLKFGKTGSEVKAVVSLKLWGWDESTTDADLVPLVLDADVRKAPTVHFNGPLIMGNYRATTEIPIDKAYDFYSLIGTPGKNGGTLTAITNSEIPDDAHPKAEFTFPNRDTSKPPIKLTTFLTVRC